MNDALVLNPNKAHFDSLSRVAFESSLVFAQNYLSFLHHLDGKTWDAIYITYDLTSHIDHDSWVDGNGRRRVYNGLHAARAIASMSELGLTKASKIFICAASSHLKEMSDILAFSSRFKVFRYDIKQDGESLSLLQDSNFGDSQRDYL